LRNLNGKVAVITGAGSGIGRALAMRLAHEGCALAIDDVDSEAVKATCDLICGERNRVSTHNFDVAKRDEVDRFACEVIEKHGHADILINNASVVISDTLEDITYPDFHWLMEINFWGVVHNTKAFLPFLKQRPEAHIINISSIDGVLATPNNGPYCAAKFAVTGLTETLSQELQGSTVKVSCVLPGGVRTNIHRNARFFKMANPDLCQEDTIECFERMASLTPEEAAQIIVKGMKKNRTRILVGRDAYFLDLMKRLMPVWTTKLVAHVMRNLDLAKIEWLGYQRREEKREAGEVQGP
jgi:NAD(P)-dependent dehydrogenase (short-subunit alcohol dehydrogenase family)